MRTVLLVLAILVSMSVVFAASDVTVTWHTHPREFSKVYDGQMSGKYILETCGSNAVVISAHLDVVAQKGVENYFQFMNELGGRVIVIPSVEVTADSTKKRDDVIVIGIDESSLGELVKYFNYGTFKHADTGFPLLQKLAREYGLVLIAAHPDNKSIPFELERFAGYCDGFELFDNSFWRNYSSDEFRNTVLKFYNKRDSLIIPGASDYHVPSSVTKVLDPASLVSRGTSELPRTHVIVDGEISRESIIEAFKKGTVYASSLVGAGFGSLTTFPGDTWVVESGSDQFKVHAYGIEGKLLHDDFTVIVKGETEVKSVDFKTRYEDGLAVLIFDFASLGMPDAKGMNIDMGGRVVTSTILIERKLEEPATQSSDYTDDAQPAAVEQPTQESPSAGGIKVIVVVDRSTSVSTKPYNAFGIATSRLVGGAIPAAWVIEFSGYKDGEFNCAISEELTDPNTFLKRFRKDTLPHDRGTAVLDALYLAGRLAIDNGVGMVILVSDMDDVDSTKSVDEVASLYRESGLKCIMLTAPQQKSGPFGGVVHGDMGRAVSALATNPQQFTLGSCDAWIQEFSR